MGDSFLGHSTVKVLSVKVPRGQMQKKKVHSKLELDLIHKTLTSIGTTHFGSVHWYIANVTGYIRPKGYPLGQVARVCD